MPRVQTRRSSLTMVSTLIVVLLLCAFDVGEGARKKRSESDETSTADPFAEYVWPPPPDKPRIKLEAVLTGIASVEAKGSKWKKLLIGITPEKSFDRLRKPIAVEFDQQGRVLVSDWASGALLRFDDNGERFDVMGTTGDVYLRRPMGLDVGPDGKIYVADVEATRVLVFDEDGNVVATYGEQGQLANPTDVAVSPNANEIYIADSTANHLVVYDAETGAKLRTIGSNGNGPGEFAYPTSLTFTPEGYLLVVDQLNSRVQMLDQADEYVDEFGGLGTGFGNFARPKDIAVDDVGFIYVTDYAYNNVQIFDADFTLLTFVGKAGLGPGGFHGASGIAVHQDRFAVVDQLGQRCQVFRFIVPKTAE